MSGVEKTTSLVEGWKGDNSMIFLKQLWQRIERLILTLISKQWLVFFMGTWLLLNKCITPDVWVVLASVVIGVNLFQKYKGVDDGNAAAAALGK